MRFFAHDGKVLRGPSTVSELVASPGFDGDTLVCPVGAADTDDWKPALAYPPFRQALLAPAPQSAPATLPATSAACPSCTHANPEGARYCNACAARMDGTIEAPPEPLAVAEAPAIPEEARAGPSAWRNTLIAAFVSAAAASGALGWWLLRPSRRPAPDVARPALSAPEPSRPVPAPATTPPPVPTTMPPEVKPAAEPKAEEKPAAKTRRASRPKRGAKPRTEAAGESFIESPVPASEPAAAPASPAPASEADRGFILPGIPRPVSKPDGSVPKTAAPAEAEDPSARQVREQFDFCAQLLAQDAYADHFDTCLCADVRAAAPYRGRRGFYATELKKSSSAGRLETKTEILSVTVDANSATVKALWKTSSAAAGRETEERWRLEDGLWCRAP